MENEAIEPKSSNIFIIFICILVCLVTIIMLLSYQPTEIEDDWHIIDEGLTNVYVIIHDNETGENTVINGGEIPSDKLFDIVIEHTLNKPFDRSLYNCVIKSDDIIIGDIHRVNTTYGIKWIYTNNTICKDGHFEIEFY